MSCIDTPAQLNEVTQKELDLFRDGGDDTPTTYTFCVGARFTPASPSSNGGLPKAYDDSAFVGVKPLVILNANRRIECPGGGCTIEGAPFLFLAPRSVAGITGRTPDISGLVIDGMTFDNALYSRPVSIYTDGYATFSNNIFSKLGYDAGVHVEGSAPQRLTVTFENNEFKFNEISTSLTNSGVLYAKRVALFMIENKFIANDAVGTSGSRMITFESASTSGESGNLYANCFAGNTQKDPGLVLVAGFANGFPNDFFVDLNFESETVIENSLPDSQNYHYQVGPTFTGKFEEDLCVAGSAPPLPTEAPTMTPVDSGASALGSYCAIGNVLSLLIVMISWLR